MLAYTLELRNHSQMSETWMIPVFVICLLGLAWVRVNYGRRVPQLFSNLINVRLMRQTMREELVLTHRASLVLSGFFILQFGLLWYLVSVNWNLETVVGTGFEMYWKMTLLVVLVYFIKLLFIRVIQWITMGEHTLNEYEYAIFLSNKSLGLLLFPLLLCVIFLDPVGARYVLIASIGIALVFYLFRVIRGIFSAFTQSVRPVYIILYLCTLEILPLLLLVKFIGS